MKKLFNYFLPLLLSFSLNASPRDEIPEEMLEKMFNTAPLASMGCTGFFVKETIFITNFHCLPPMGDRIKDFGIMVDRAKTLKFEKVINFSEIHDLAILKVEKGWQGEIATLGSQNITKESISIYAAGYASFYFQVFQGECCSLISKGKKRGHFVMNRPQPVIAYPQPPKDYLSEGGLSGGPVFGPNGKVIGIVNSSLRKWFAGRRHIVFAHIIHLIQLMDESNIVVDISDKEAP